MTIKIVGRQQPRSTPVFVFYRVFDHIVQSQFPFVLIKRRNPWFDYLVRRLYRRARRLPKRIKRFTIKWACIVPFAIAVLGCLTAPPRRGTSRHFLLSDL